MGKLRLKKGAETGPSVKSLRDFRRRHGPVGEDEGILQVTWGVEAPLPEGCITARAEPEQKKARTPQGGEVGT